MGPKERELGMGKEITRRDFVQRTAAAMVAGAAIAQGAGGFSAAAAVTTGEVGAPAPTGLNPKTYPPLRTGLRGSHPGSFEAAHDLASGGREDWGAVENADETEYDLVVVGAGISGLAAAHFYAERNPNARILILENHDDFGGHAKRNEFHLDGRMILGHGGSQSLENPSNYSHESKALLRKIGVKPKRLKEAYDHDFYKRNGLAGCIYFDKESYGVDRVVRGVQDNLIKTSRFLPLASSELTTEEAVAQMPISDAAKREFIRLITLKGDHLPDHSVFTEPGVLAKTTYLSFLTEKLGVTDPEVIGLLQDIPSFYKGVGIDAAMAMDCFLLGMPGLRATSLGRVRGLLNLMINLVTQPYVYHFPDGNASVARMLVRQLVPHASSGSTMEDIITAPFDYAKLDRPDTPVRLRLNSTVIRVAHDGDPKSARHVDLTYIRDGKAQRVRTRNCVLACYNMMIPHLCPDLPDHQAQALSSLVKIPFVFSNVLIRNWTAFKKLGIGMAYSPKCKHQVAIMDFPVSFDHYRYGSDADQPVILLMQWTPTSPGKTPREQYRAARMELLSTPFKTIERGIRRQLGGMLGAGGFDPASDIQGLTVNRWPHGFAFQYNKAFDPEYEKGQAPHEIGRQSFGRIAIANSDAGASAYLDAAIDQAWRAVGELER